MKLNRQMWDQERLSTETAIRAIKKEIRGKDGASCGEWSELHAQKARAAFLYKIRAHVRGKLHQKLKTVYKPGQGGTTVREVLELTLEDQAKEVEIGLPCWLLPEEPETATGT